MKASVLLDKAVSLPVEERAHLVFPAGVDSFY